MKEKQKESEHLHFNKHTIFMSAGNNVSLYQWVIYITVHMTVSDNLFYA